MKELFKANIAFLAPYLLFFMVLAIFCLTHGKAEVHLWLNSAHTPTLDTFFAYFTKVGESIPYIIGIALLFRKMGAGIFLIVGQLTGGVIAQLIKHTVEAPRPKLFFANHFPDISLPFVEGVRVHSNLSFPSGHTTSFFALFFGLALLAKSRTQQSLYIALALLGGYSRIYLSQHFAVDVLAGSVIGISVMLFWWFAKFPLSMPWSNKPIYRLRKRQAHTTN